MQAEGVTFLTGQDVGGAVGAKELDGSAMMRSHFVAVAKTAARSQVFPAERQKAFILRLIF